MGSSEPHQRKRRLMRRREAKAATKRQQVLHLLHLAQQCGSPKLLAPRIISQLTNVSRQEIYRLKVGSKRHSTSILKHKDPVLVKLIGEIIVARGLRTLNLDTVMKELAEKG